MLLPTGTLLVARDVGAAWGREQVEQLAMSLELRLHQPVAVSFPESEEHPLVDGIQALVNAHQRRIIMVPLGLLPISEQGQTHRRIAWAKRRWSAVEYHVAAPLTWPELSRWLRITAIDAVHARGDQPDSTAVLLVGEYGADPLVNSNLPRLGHLIYEGSPLAMVTHAFLSGLRPSIAEAVQTIAHRNCRNLIVLPWLISDRQALQDLENEIQRAATSHTLPARMVTPSLAHPALINLIVSNHYAALSEGNRLPSIATASVTDDGVNAGHDNFIFADASDEALELQELEAKLNALLPPQYQSKFQDVRPQSMGTASLKLGSDGKVAWGEIWTSFCDLALAGGPPHRGTLLEAVTGQDAMAEAEQYEAVVAEIERGIQLAASLPTVRSRTAGWVGVRCESEAMAVWLMRAIIVENIMVRREGIVLYLPAGPRFRVEREIKNVVTAIAKTVHYWTAHLNAKRRSQEDCP